MRTSLGGWDRPRDKEPKITRTKSAILRDIEMNDRLIDKALDKRDEDAFLVFAEIRANLKNELKGL